MSPSKSLTTALEAVERIFEADTSDLMELALIAGADPNQIFVGADLTGLDLRFADVGFLLHQNVDFEGARLTDGQRRAFRAAQRSRKNQSVRDAQQDERISAVKSFVQYYSTREDLLPSSKGEGVLPIALLESELLWPIEEFNRRNARLTPEFTRQVLSAFGPWCSHAHFATSPNFIVELFELLGRLRSPIDGEVVAVLNETWRPDLGEVLVRCVIAFGTNSILDSYWLDRLTLNKTFEAASDIGDARMVSGAAVENVLNSSVDLALGSSWRKLLEFFVQIPFDCDYDRAERLALLLTQSNWSAEHTAEILRAPTPAKIRTALFRQILAQGSSDRVLEVLRWLNDSRGAVGALSLENALAQINEFDPILRLAVELEPNLSEMQLRVFAVVLKQRAFDRYQVSQAERFEKYLVQPASSRPLRRKVSIEKNT